MHLPLLCPSWVERKEESQATDGTAGAPSEPPLEQSGRRRVGRRRASYFPDFLRSGACASFAGMPRIHSQHARPSHSKHPARRNPAPEVEVLVLDDAFDPYALEGLYAVSSRSAAYPLSLDCIDQGLAEVVGEHHLEDESFVRVLRFGQGRRNPDDFEEGEQRTVRLGPEYFQKPLQEYSEWPLKWWREVVQNSVDAGCTEMTLGTRDNKDGTITVYAEDDGKGMDRSTLLDKFLVLGGTTKVGAAGKTGGFGKAKELLLLPWLGWRMQTQSIEVAGAGADYRVRSIEPRRGTRLEVTMSSDVGAHTTILAAKEFLQRCHIPTVRFNLVDENDPSNNSSIVPVSDVNDMELIGEGSRFISYYREGKDSYTAWLRVNGLFMFDIYLGRVPGQIVVELQGSSLDILHSNRDGVRDKSVLREIGQFQEKLAKDTSSALRAKKGHIKKKYVSDKKFEAPRLTSPTYLPIEIMKPSSAQPDKQELTEEAVDEIMKDFGEHVRNDDAVERAAREALAREQLQSLAFSGDSHLEAALAQLSWKPDFILMSEVDNFKVTKRFLPETMSVRVKRLASVWVECCRWVLMQLGCNEKYSVGFYFTQSAAAAYLRESDENWLLLNPFAERTGLDILQSINYGWSDQKKVEKELLDTMFQVTTRADFQWLYSLAVHECTHFADNVMYHDEAFASALTKNFAKCADGMKQYRRIMDATKGGRVAGED